jgi:hypothetical protein
MTDLAESTAPDAAAAAPADAPSEAPTEAPLFDAERRATELAILDALRAVVDPEIGMNVVEHEVKVTLLAERWDPRDAGLMW